MALTHDKTDLALINVKVVYKGDKYVKFKATLIHKKYGHVYETKNYKMNIGEWDRLEELK